MKYHFAFVFLPVFWFLLLDTSITLTIVPICLTWNTTISYLTVECTVHVGRYMNDIVLVDPFGDTRVKCSLGESPSCSGSSSHVLHKDDSENITTLTIKTEKKNANGEWICRQGNKEAKSYVSLTKGSIPMIAIGISGEIWKTKETNEFKLACFSCWKPYSNGVDIYVNHVLEDSIRYQDGLCYHKRDLCNPEKCTCTSKGKRFTWSFTSDVSYIQFTCEMRFKYHLKSVIFIRRANLLYNGSVLIQKQTSNGSIISAPNNPDNTFRKTEETDMSEYIGYSILGTICLIISVIHVICLWQIMKIRKIQDNRQDRKNQYELIPLQDNDLLRGT